MALTGKRRVYVDEEGCSQLQHLRPSQLAVKYEEKEPGMSVVYLREDEEMALLEMVYASSDHQYRLRLHQVLEGQLLSFQGMIS
jgi:hypothetical protein